MRTGNLIRVGDTIINLDRVMVIDLDAQVEGEAPNVVCEFSMRGSDELDKGENWAYPYLKFFSGDEAVAIRKHLKAMCPDLLEAE